MARERTLWASIYSDLAEMQAAIKRRPPPYKVSFISMDGPSKVHLEFSFDAQKDPQKEKVATETLRDWLEGATSCGGWAVGDVAFA